MLTENDFETLVICTEAIINKRPLAVKSVDEKGISAISPYDFLYPSVSCHSKNYLMVPQVPSNDDMKSHIQRLSKVINEFENRLKNDYILTLQKREKWALERPNIAVNDIVMMVDASPRYDWRLARVTEVIDSRDGLARRVKIETAEYAGIKNVYERNRNQLVRLELDWTPANVGKEKN